MARSQDVSDGSQEANSGPSQNYAGRSRVAQGKVAQTRRSGRANGRVESDDEGTETQSTASQDGADVHEGAEEAEEEDSQDSPKGRKRARVNVDGEARIVDAPVKAKTRTENLPRDRDNFIPGSIVRIRLKNFVTYDEVEFRTGPYLNMIYGPNGTGKSTIACAICLGLNFPPNVLGRASDLNSFVKMGTDKGFIEIELKGPIGQPNLIIRRSLTADSKSSTFTLNGRAATGREINARIAELNIQVGNLCTFLPQDRVSEFARMSPQELLRETQRAAGNENLTAWHDTLIAAGKELKQLQERLKVDREQLNTMESRNKVLEKEVRAFEERHKIVKQIELLELILPFSEYVEAKDRYLEAKKVQRELHEKVKGLQEKNAPIIDMQKSLERQLKERDRLREAKKASCKAQHDSMRKMWKLNEQLETEAEDLKTKLFNLRTAEKSRLKDIQSIEKKNRDYQEYLDNPPETESMDDVQKEFKHISAEQSKLRHRHNELQEKQKAHVDEESKHHTVVRELKTRLAQLDDVSVRKLQTLTRWDKDCGEAVTWLRSNHHRFKMPIIEPAVLSVTVPDKRFVHAVESCVGNSQMKTFVAQCEEDYQLLNKVLVDTPEALGRRVRIPTWYRARGERVPEPPMNAEQMHALGFDGYALDFVECEEGMKWFLTADAQMHRTAIALNASRVNVDQATELVARSGGASFIVGNVANSVTRSRYGKRLPQNSTREVRAARNWVHTDVDPTIKRDLERRIAEAETALTEGRTRLEELSREDAAIQADHKRLKERYDNLVQRRRIIEEVVKKKAQAAARIRTNNEKLQELRNAPSVEVERTKLKANLLACAKRRADIVSKYAKGIRDVIIEQQEATRMGLQYLQISANKAALQALFDAKDGEYRRALADFNEAHKLYEKAKEDSKIKVQISREKLAAADPEIRDKFRDMERSGEAHAKTAEEIREELEFQRVTLESNSHTNAGVVEQFKKRQTAIEALSNTIELHEKDLERVERTIKQARNNWQPALEQLVHSIGTKFSAAFDRIGCAGEIKISEQEDYDKWAIDILVKFRDSERLQLLTGERQSGGERSLTTILYLMSLTEEARAPFSLVDEINQGMDQRAERAVHNSLVEVTCKADSGQYFLITPKLLPDLNYHERMKVLCVCNGEWLPEEPRVGNMMGLIDSYVKFRDRSVGAA